MKTLERLSFIEERGAAAADLEKARQGLIRKSVESAQIRDTGVEKPRNILIFSAQNIPDQEKILRLKEIEILKQTIENLKKAVLELRLQEETLKAEYQQKRDLKSWKQKKEITDQIDDKLSEINRLENIVALKLKETKPEKSVA